MADSYTIGADGGVGDEEDLFNFNLTGNIFQTPTSLLSGTTPLVDTASTFLQGAQPTFQTPLTSGSSWGDISNFIKPDAFTFINPMQGAYIDPYRTGALGGYTFSQPGLQPIGSLYDPSAYPKEYVTTDYLSGVSPTFFTSGTAPSDIITAERMVVNADPYSPDILSSVNVDYPGTGVITLPNFVVNEQPSGGMVPSDQVSVVDVTNPATTPGGGIIQLTPVIVSDQPITTGDLYNLTSGSITLTPGNIVNLSPFVVAEPPISTQTTEGNVVIDTGFTTYTSLPPITLPPIFVTPGPTPTPLPPTDFTPISTTFTTGSPVVLPPVVVTPGPTSTTLPPTPFTTFTTTFTTGSPLVLPPIFVTPGTTLAPEPTTPFTSFTTTFTTGSPIVLPPVVVTPGPTPTTLPPTSFTTSFTTGTPIVLPPVVVTPPPSLTTQPTTPFTSFTTSFTTPRITFTPFTPPPTTEPPTPFTTFPTTFSPTTGGPTVQPPPSTGTNYGNLPMRDLETELGKSLAALQKYQPQMLGMYSDIYNKFMPESLTAAAKSALSQLSADEQKLANLRAGILSPEDIRQSQQTAREAYGARGQVMAPGAIGAEILNREAVRQAREDQARAAYQQSMGNLFNAANLQTGNIFNPISSLISGSFNPLGAYPADVYGTNVNAQLAREIAQRNYEAAVESARLAGAAQKSAANTGFLGDLFGVFLPEILKKVPVVCWVAREVYGDHNPKWLQFRDWLFRHSPAWFFNLYIKHGEAFARWLRKNPWLKPAIRWWMDGRIRSMQSRQLVLKEIA